MGEKDWRKEWEIWKIVLKKPQAFIPLICAICSSILTIIMIVMTLKSH